MGQISAETYALPGSVLSGNQHHYIARRITQLRIGQEAATGAPHLTSEEAAALEMKLGMACLSGKPGAVVRLGEHQRERLQFFGQHGLKGVWDLLKDRPELLTDFCTGKVDGHCAIVVAPDCVMLDNGNLAPHDPRYLATRRTAFMLGAALAPAGALDKPGGWCPRQVPKPLPTDPIAQLGEIFGCPRAVKLIADQCKDDFATVRRVITTLGAAYRGDNLGKVGCIVAMGPTGCGKSQPIDMMEVVFGEDDAGIIESSVLSGAKSNGDPELIQICSRLFAGCHEWQSYRDSDFGRMKLMVEGKPLPLRDNHARASDGKRFEYRFGGVLYLATNNPPRVPEDVGALVERCLVLCPDQIASTMRKNDKLGVEIAIEEGPAIIRMLVMMGARHKRNDPVPARVIINRKKLFTAMSGPTITEDVQDWIAARCTVGRGLTITASDALRSFQDWFRLTMGEEAKTGSKGLKKELEGLGYPASRTKTSRFFAGLALTAQPQNGAASRPQMSPLVPAAPQPAALVKPVIPPASSPTPPAVAGAAQPGTAAQTNGSAALSP